MEPVVREATKVIENDGERAPRLRFDPHEPRGAARSQRWSHHAAGERVTEQPATEADSFRLAHQRKASRHAGLLRALGVTAEREQPDEPAT
jgi:hypothetical protein